MAAYPNLPFHLLPAGQPYHHNNYVVNEVRCLRALLEAGTRCYEAHHTYFPHDLLNRQHMAMACHRRLERSVDEWELRFQVTPPSETDARAEFYITGPCWCSATWAHGSRPIGVSLHPASHGARQAPSHSSATGPPNPGRIVSNGSLKT